LSRFSSLTLISSHLISPHKKTKQDKSKHQNKTKTTKMNIHMNLFCLIVALATSITDGRISSSSSSSSSSLSQPVDGSAEDVNPNRRVLNPAGVDSETQYCMATPVGKQRGVVDWQEHDQCKMCEVGQKYWPCDGDILCEGQCTPEDVCDKRIQVAIDDLQQDTDAPSSAPSMGAAAIAAAAAAAAAAATTTPPASDCTAKLEESEAIKDLIITSLEIAMKKNAELKQETDKENDILRETVAVLKANLANTDAPITAPSTSKATDFDYASFYNSIKNRPIVDTVLYSTTCSDNSPSGGDCSQSPTYCYSADGQDYDYLERNDMIPDKNIVGCRCEDSYNPSSRTSDKQEWTSEKQECRGSCSGYNTCLNLDFVCSPSAAACEISCSGKNSCNGLTMYCADNQVCKMIACGDGTERCVGAKVVYNGEIPSRFGFSSASDRTWNNNNSFSKNDIDF